jgi:hypothetical protein
VRSGNAGRGKGMKEGWWGGGGGFKVMRKGPDHWAHLVTI